MELEQIIKNLHYQGKSYLEIVTIIREKGINVPVQQIQNIYLKITR